MENTDDRRLLDFSTYEDYLDSFITKEDLKFLRSSRFARMISELGYRSITETLTRDQFLIKKEIVREQLFPTGKRHQMSSDNLTSSDPLLQELALREQKNRLRLLSTIIFIRHYTKSGFEISGYIDFEQSLRKCTNKEEDAVDWPAIFQEKKRLWPQVSDLSYFHWRSGYSTYNDSDNYEVIIDPFKGLEFMHKGDRTIICVDPLLKSPGSYSTRTIIFSDNYHHIILYDHIVRNKM